MTLFKVGKFSVDPDSGRVRSDDSEVSLQPQVMQLLVFLAEHPGEVISIDRMIDEVWQGKPMTSGSVYNALNSLRKTFGDSKEDPRYIETIPRKGYRLVAAVEQLADTADESVRAPATDTDTGMPGAREIATSSRWLPFLMAVLVLAVLMWAGFRFISVRESAVEDTLPPENSIAVLPFVDMSSGGDQAYFAEGIAEEILHIIARHPGLKVVGRTSSFAYRDREIDLRQIARELGVAYILEGSVRRDGPRIRITAQLIKAENGYHVWSREYDSEIGDILSIQNRIAANISGGLGLPQPGVDGESRDANTDRRPFDANAHDLLLLARYRVNEGTREGLDEAVQFLRRALEIDPGFARAHAELAYAHITQRNMFPSQYPHSHFALDGPAMRHAQQALELDSLLADAYAVQGMVYQLQIQFSQRAEYQNLAEEMYRKALAINPNDARTHLWLSGLMRVQGRSWSERLVPARRAMELDPGWEFARSFYVQLIQMMPQRRAEKWLMIKQGLDRNVDEFGWKRSEGNAYWEEGRLATAYEAHLEMLEIDPNYDSQGLSEARLFYLLGSPRSANRGGAVVQPFESGLFPGMPIPWADRCSLARNESLTPGTAVSCAYWDLHADRTEQAGLVLKETLPDDLQQFRAELWSHLGSPDSPALSLATLHKIDGNVATALAYLHLEEEALQTKSDGGLIESRVFSKTESLMYAVRGEYGLALDKMEEQIALGARDFKDFMHPALNGLRDHPRFVALLEHWVDLINQERAQFGLSPLEPNYAVGPGVLPFVLLENEPQATIFD